MGFDRIARTLNDKGVPTPGQGRWHGWAVNQILRRQQRQLSREKLRESKGVPTPGQGRWHGWAVNQILRRQQRQLSREKLRESRR